MRKAIGFLAVLMLVFAACSERAGAPDPTTTTTSSTTTSSPPTTLAVPPGTGSALASTFDPNSIQFLAAMRGFDGCDGVLEYFRSEALARVGPYGLEGSPNYFPWIGVEEFAVDDTVQFSEGATTTAAASRALGNDSFSGTNVQVSGVDEADIIKTDGNRIIAVSQGRLVVVEIDGTDGEVRGSIPLPNGWGQTIFLHGDRVFVISQGDGWAVPLARSSTDIAPVPWQNAVVVTSIDISNPARMRVERSASIEGRYVSARMVDGTVRLVTSSYPSDLPFVYPSSQSAEATAEASNRRVVLESTIEDWLPAYTVTDGDGNELSSGTVVACDKMHSPAEFSGFETLSVMTIDLDGAVQVSPATGIVGRGDTVYSSLESLYVTSNVWFPQELLGDERMNRVSEDWRTAVHKFTIDADGNVEYRASGSVKGHLLNQFSMDEFEGHLRIATTHGAPWWGSGEESVSFVTVLAEEGDELVEVGQVGNLGKGERIYSVRFMGETGYVVTFRQVDPLYVLDLRNPRRPKVTGELKIPGYSAYLHPLGDGLLLGVGQDADDRGMTRGAKVSLFDVSDPENPREVEVWTDSGSSTDVEWDHHAFTYWPATGQVFLPLQDWNSGFFGAVVFDTNDGLREVGRISHKEIEGMGATDCEKTDLGADGFYGGLVLVCGDSQRGGATGYTCEVFPEEELQYLIDEVGNEFGTTIDVGEDERVEVCWPYYDDRQPIQRSIVIGDAVWTMSYSTLQANALDGLGFLDLVELR